MARADPPPTASRSGLSDAAEGARQALSARIESGELRSGQRLGAERDLAEELSISRFALRQALAALETVGVVRRVPGRGGGTFVRHASKIERDLSTIVGVPAYLRSQGFTAGTRVLRTAIEEADELTARQLELEPGELVVDLVRIRLADGSPLSLEQARLPAAMFPGLLEMPLGGSIYQLLRERFDLGIADAVERVEIVAAGVDEAALLEVSTGVPLLSILRVARTPSGTAFEFSHDLFRGDRTRIVVRTQGSGISAEHHSGEVAPAEAREFEFDAPPAP